MKKSTIQKEKIDNVGIHSFSKKSNFFFTLLLTLVGLTCVLPFIFVVMISLTDEQSLAVHGFQFWPAKFGFDGYLFLVQFKEQNIASLFITLFVTIVGTACNVFITTTYAYAISRSTFKYRKFFTVFSLLSMLFSAGLVPSYIVTTQLLQLGDTIGALIIPMLLSPFNIILMRPSLNGPFQKLSLNPLGSMGQVKHGSSSKSACHCLYQGLQLSVCSLL